MAEAERAVAAEPGDGPLSQRAALKVRDASMVLTAFGQSSLAQRGLVLCTAKASKYARTPCVDSKCRLSHLCCGNRFEAAPGTSISSGMQLVVAHQKSNKAAVLRLSVLEAQMATLYERRARPFFVACAAPTEMMYVTLDGRPYTNSTLCLWWKKLHA